MPVIVLPLVDEPGVESRLVMSAPFIPSQPYPEAANVRPMPEARGLESTSLCRTGRRHRGIHCVIDKPGQAEQLLTLN